MCVPVDCEIDACGVLAVGRCRTCGAPFCDTHRARSVSGEEDPFNPGRLSSLPTVYVDLCQPCWTEGLRSARRNQQAEAAASAEEDAEFAAVPPLHENELEAFFQGSVVTAPPRAVVGSRSKNQRRLVEMPGNKVAAALGACGVPHRRYRVRHRGGIRKARAYHGWAVRTGSGAPMAASIPPPQVWLLLTTDGLLLRFNRPHNASGQPVNEMISSNDGYDRPPEQGIMERADLSSFRSLLT